MRSLAVVLLLAFGLLSAVAGCRDRSTCPCPREPACGCPAPCGGDRCP